MTLLNAVGFVLALLYLNLGDDAFLAAPSLKKGERGVALDIFGDIVYGTSGSCREH